jgi:phosphoribosylformylglycinamidine synthase
MVLTEADARIITEALGRQPNEVEVAIFENLWSEHCAYRTSKPLLQTMPTQGEVVVVPPGDDAAIIKLSDELALAIAMESHNHPSYVDPYDGAATGVGGIVRDVISMGAQPIALMDCLYFGSVEKEKNRYLFEHVVQAISDYGNCIGCLLLTEKSSFTRVMMEIHSLTLFASAFVNLINMLLAA